MVASAGGVGSSRRRYQRTRLQRPCRRPRNESLMRPPRSTPRDTASTSTRRAAPGESAASSTSAKSAAPLTTVRPAALMASDHERRGIEGPVCGAMASVDRLGGRAGKTKPHEATPRRRTPSRAPTRSRGRGALDRTARLQEGGERCNGPFPLYGAAPRAV
jgi:hypothetical protein